MPVAVVDGWLGLEARWDWEGMTRLLNDRSALPRIKLTRIGGLGSYPEVQGQAEQLGGRIGEEVRPANVSGKTVTLEGLVQATTLQEMRQVCSELRGGFANFHNEKRMEVVPHPDYGNQRFAFHARTLQLDMDEEQLYGPTRMPSAFQRNFVLSLRLSDPRWYTWENPDMSGVGEVVLDTGAAGPYPLTVTVDNDGTAPTDPVIEVGINGLPQDVVVTIRNETLGKQLVTYPIPNALLQTVTFDFGARTILNEGNDVSGYLDPFNSDWWDENVPGIQTGENDITVSDRSEIRFRHAFW